MTSTLATLRSPISITFDRGTITVAPSSSRERVTISQSRPAICFTSTPAIAGSTVCPVVTALVTGLSFYNSSTNYGYFNVMFKPMHGVTAAAGYNVTAVNGSTLILNPISPAGPLTSTFHRPTASLAVDLAKGWTWKAGWGYHNYNEEAVPDLIGARKFSANLVNLSLRYVF